MKLLTEKQLQHLKDAIKVELTKRGYHVDIDLEEVERKSYGNNKLKLSSGEFQTIPVIFKSLYLTEFGSNVESIEHSEQFGGEDKTKLIKVHLTINVAYQLFSMGGNSTTLFGFRCLFEPSRDNCFNVVIA